MIQNSKKDRIKMAYDYLYSKGVVHSVTELADKMNRARPGVSNALSGNQTYLNDKFMTAFALTFREISLDWLMTGEGEMVIRADESQGTCNPNSAYDIAIDTLKSQLADKDKIIEMLEKENDELKAQVEHLKAISYDSDLRDFPFNMGVSEVKPKKQPRV